MIHFPVADQHQFTLRAAAIIINRDRLLVQEVIENAEEVCFLPGGRVEIGESADVAIRRELQEELGTEPISCDLAIILENFFTWIDGWRTHELGLYFHVALPDNFPNFETDSFDFDEPNGPLTFRWLNLATLPSARLYPTFLRDVIPTLQPGLQHIVHVDSPLE